MKILPGSLKVPPTFISHLNLRHGGGFSYETVFKYVHVRFIFFWSANMHAQTTKVLECRNRMLKVVSM